MHVTKELCTLCVPSIPTWAKRTFPKIVFFCYGLWGVRLNSRFANPAAQAHPLLGGKFPRLGTYPIVGDAPERPDSQADLSGAPPKGGVQESRQSKLKPCSQASLEIRIRKPAVQVRPGNQLTGAAWISGFANRPFRWPPKLCHWKSGFSNPAVLH